MDRLRPPEAGDETQDLIADRVFLVFGDDWGRFPSTIQHLMGQFVPRNRVLWVGSLGQRRPTLSGRDIGRMVRKLGRVMGRSPLTKGPANVVMVTPPVIPWHDVTLVRRFNSLAIRRTVESVLSRYRLRAPILISSTPVVADLVGHLGETASVYLCLDDYARFDGAFRVLPSLERMMLDRVDLCVCMSKKLAAEKTTRRRTTLLLPQGVDVRHFTPDGGDLPESMRVLRRPIIGFFGLLTTWVDVELICLTAAAYPENTVALLGPADVDTSCFDAHPNIALLGRIAYEDLPAYARAFDVGMIPFRVNDLTRAANPLKFLEYMALGIPTVATDLPEVSAYGDFALVARSREEFVRLIGRALRDTSRTGREERRALAQRHSWSLVAGRFSDALREALGGRREVARP